MKAYLRRLRASARSGVQRALCCPNCAGEVELDGQTTEQRPRYVCNGCLWESDTLADLAIVVEGP